MTERRRQREERHQQQYTGREESCRKAVGRKAEGRAEVDRGNKEGRRTEGRETSGSDCKKGKRLSEVLWNCERRKREVETRASSDYMKAEEGETIQGKKRKKKVEKHSEKLKKKRTSKTENLRIKKNFFSDLLA